MKKHLALTVLILFVLSIVVSCGEDPFFHTITIKKDGETLGTETVRDGSKYTLPKEYKGIGNLSGWTIDDDETVYDLGQEITVTKDITINAYTVQPYFDYVDLGEDYNGWEVTLKDEYLETVTDVVIPSSYEGKPVIYVFGFNNATNLVSVTFPSTVEFIYGFNRCEKLEKITVLITVRPQARLLIQTYTTMVRKRQSPSVLPPGRIPVISSTAGISARMVIQVTRRIMLQEKNTLVLP